MQSKLMKLLAAFGIAVSLAAQTPVPDNTQWTLASQRAAEDQVAMKLDSMRASAKLPKLKRVNPSVVDLQLVCTSALTGKEVRDPRFGGLNTYVTRDLSAETEALKIVALGKSQPASGGTRYGVYSDKGWPRYSIVVLLDRTSTPTTRAYRVALARRMSLMAEFTVPVTYDHPIADANDWKEQVDPACRSIKP